ncbi:MAG: adenylate/guanylate cyclase domain-containing protein [Leptolyngbyaceae bacterium]|nr:adenylate/guanylate cyclase domain-containing protein [Leptolyngbyaceae bacterium]
MLPNCRKIVNSQQFQLFFLVVLLLEGSVLIIQTLTGRQGYIQLLADILFKLVMLLLLFEIVVEGLQYWPRIWQYFYKANNLLTFGLFLLLLAFPTERYASLLRIPRVFRLMMVPMRVITIKSLSLIKVLRIIEIISFHFNRVINGMMRQLQVSFVALDQSEARNRALLKAIPDLILEIDRNGIYIDYVEAEGRWLPQQASSAERIGQSVHDVLPPDLAHQYMAVINQVLGDRQPQYLEYNLRLNEVTYTYEARVVAYSETSVLFVVRDITERKRVELDLRRSEATNRALISAIPDLLIRMKRDGTYLGMVAGNDIALFNAAQVEQENSNIREILPPHLAQKRLDYIQRALESETIQLYEQQLELQGQLRYEEVRIVPMGDDEVLNIVRDITARMWAEAELRRANEELEQRVAQRTAELQREKERSEQLLLNILPGSIAEQLKLSGQSPAEHFEEVTILFADIVGFTGLAARIEPLRLVDKLNQIFSAFDHLVDRYQLEKIKTIGDAYMAVGGLPMARADHAEAIAHMALDMQAYMHGLPIDEDLESPLRIRIGINTGPVIAGVIGLKRFIYDLWGDAVNIAARMESHGEPGNIQVTEATYLKLQGKFDLQKRGPVLVKGRGEMTTYWLLGR